MKGERQNDISELLAFAGSRKVLTFIGLILSGISMLFSMVPYICIWLTARSLIEVAPHWREAVDITRYGWTAFIFAFGGIAIYFAGLMCTHLAAFRTASNIRKQGVHHVMDAPLGYFDSNASGLIRGRLDAAAADTETLLAHNLADIVGTIVLFVAMIVLMLVFDWRMGLACMIAAVISVSTMAAMMGGKNAKLMAEYQAAQDRMTKAGTEYVRGIPVVKIFQQTVYSFKAFKEAIEEYSDKAEYYQAKVSGKSVQGSAGDKPYIHRRRIRISGTSCIAARTKSHCRWKSRIPCHGFRLLCSLFSDNIHCSCKNHVRFSRHDAFTYSTRTHQQDNGCSAAEERSQPPGSQEQQS